MESWQTKYRPQKFSDLHLQRVRTQMEKFAASGTLPQVLLFAGPKGTGKTSTARIIAALLNTKANEKLIEKLYLAKKPPSPQDKLVDPDLSDPEIKKIIQGNSYVVVEIDAASHRGIDDIRALQEQIHLPPALGKVMVYILDEAHMFTSEAFNALLKVLEEPPAHAFFILATTESHKIPATVISRCQIIHFQQASLEELQAAFKKILATEKLTAPAEVLSALAQLADGSFRDGVKYLQLLANTGELTLTKVAEVLVGNQSAQTQELLALILAKKPAPLSDFFARLRAQNTDEKFFLKNFAQFLYQQLLDNLQKTNSPTLSAAQARYLLALLLNLPPSQYLPFLNLEVALLNLFAHSPSKKP